ncbi:hypothetical protein BC833DRAFT_574848 [Globomyces pollinis-pini]|nr:hypothetical protein BC833DRAFT_574848 [Globomyces pollinis-pini]
MVKIEGTKSIQSSLFGSIQLDENNHINSLFNNSQKNQIPTKKTTQKIHIPNEKTTNPKEDLNIQTLPQITTTTKKVKKIQNPTEITIAPKKAQKVHKKVKSNTKIHTPEKIASDTHVNEPKEIDSAPKTNDTNESDKVEKVTRKQQIMEKIAINERTIFVGNLPVNVVDKANTKDLKLLFSQFGDIDSVRFRSIAFSEKLPRKQAFIAKKLHDGRDTLNAYIMFKSSEAVDDALSLNGSVFMEKHIRVDRSEKKVEKVRDSSRSVFIGNLPFDISDESLWSFFLVVGEIENVRVIRDRKTNVGKGFGYVQFKEKSSIPLALKCNGNELCGRKIRITKAVESLAQSSKEKTTKKTIVEGTRASRLHGLKPKGKTLKVSKKTKPEVSKKSGEAPKKVKKPRTNPRRVALRLAAGLQ